MFQVLVFILSVYEKKAKKPNSSLPEILCIITGIVASGYWPQSLFFISNIAERGASF